MKHLKVWGRKTSSNVQALMWCIGELELPHERFDVGHIYGGNTTPQYLAMNPNGAVPVLQDNDGQPIWETGAILRYLASVYGSDDFWPKQPNMIASIDKWAEWSKINITLNFTVPVFWRVVRTNPSERDANAIQAALEYLDKYLTIANTQLAQNTFLAGENFTLADIQFGHCLYRYFDIEITRPEYKHINRYYAALKRRAAYQEHVMIDYEELRVTD